MQDPSKGRDEDGINEVNVIPLADLTLVLLIIMMVISPMVLQSMINVQASSATGVQVGDRKVIGEAPLIVVVNPDGVFLNSLRISNEKELMDKLQDALIRRSDKTVMLTADPKVRHGDVVNILDAVKQSGADKVALLKKRPDFSPNGA